MTRVWDKSGGCYALQLGDPQGQGRPPGVSSSLSSMSSSSAPKWPRNSEHLKASGYLVRFLLDEHKFARNGGGSNLPFLGASSQN